MKKKISLAVGTLAAAAVLGLGIYHSDASQAEPKLSSDEIETLILDQYPGTITEMELDKDFNKTVYEIEIEGKGKEYELTVDGNSGEILKIHEKTVLASNADDNKTDDKKTDESNDEKTDDTDDKNTLEIAEKDKQGTQKKDTNKQKKASKDDKKNQSNTAKKAKSSKAEKKAVITVNEASTIALGAFAGTIAEIELDDEDGRLIYEVEIERDDQEAEIEINAYTGEVLVIEIDD